MPVWETPVGATVEWYTPPEVFERLGLRFDLDVASPEGGVPWVPAVRFYTRADDGLTAPWSGRIYLNPPYGPETGPFMERMAKHHHGIALTASRTEVRWWQAAAASADAVCFLRERLHFIRSDGYQGRSSHASTIFAWGEDCVDALVRADLGWVVIRGHGRTDAGPDCDAASGYHARPHRGCILR